MTSFSHERHQAAELSDRMHSAAGRYEDAVTIVLVNDDAHERLAMADALRRDGYVVAEATSSRDALGLLESPGHHAIPALIVSEVRMPSLDGIELAACVRNAGHRMPILLLTESADEDLVSIASHAGATAVFSKPFDLGDLRTAVSYFAPRPSVDFLREYVDAFARVGHR